MNARFRWTLTNQSDASVEVLSRDPVGWDELDAKLMRDTLYQGVFIDFTGPLKWHCNGGGKQFLDNIYQTQDINAIVTVLIEMDCDGTGGYVSLYTGRVNLASYKTDGEYTTYNIEKSDAFTKLKARDEIKVDLRTLKSIGNETITRPNLKIIALDGMEITLDNDYETPHLTYPDMPFFIGYLFILPDIFYNIAGDGSPIGIKDTRYKPKLNIITSSLGGVPVVNDDEYNDDDFQISEIYQYEEDIVLTRAPLDVNYHIVLDGLFQERDGSAVCADTFVHTHNFKLILAYGDDWDTRTEIVLFDWDTTPGDDNAWTRATGAVHNETLAVDVSGTLTLSNNQRVWFYFWHQAEGFAGITSPCLGPDPFFISSQFAWQFNDTCLINLEVISTFPETTASTVLIHEAFNQVSDAIIDSNNKFYSDFYGRIDSQKITYGSDGCGSLLAITNGLNIRQFENRPIFCSMRELFESANALHNIGLTIENGIIRIEALEYFYDKITQILNLTKPVKVETTNDNTRYLNNIQIGYTKWETETRGGLDEPNTKHEYSTIVNAVKGDYKRLSQYIASTYAIELTRRHNKNINSDLADYQYDNDNFFFALIRNIYAGLIMEKYDDSFANGSGMVALTTAYNLRLTPARMLLAHIGNIAAGLQIINGQIKFVRGDGNTELDLEQTNLGCQEDYGGEILGENQSFDWNDLNAANITPLWLPEIYNFEYPLTASDLVAMRANPHGYIQFLDDHGNTLKGFILEANFELRTGKTKFTLLRVFG